MKHIISKKGFIICFVILPVILACGSHNIVEPTISNKSYIEGVWVPVNDTLSYMQQLGYKFSSHRIEFVSDGTIKFVNIPEAWIYSQNPETAKLFSGVGIWSLAENLIPNMGDIQPQAKIFNPSEHSITIRFGTVLDNLYFYPGNIPTDINRIRFQKCYPSLHLTDQSLLPLMKALYTSKRDVLGFSALTPMDRIEQDGIIGKNDVGLHIYNDFSNHDIFFRFRNNDYVWVFEQESFTGPEKWVDSDAATWQETIEFQYQTEDINGGPINGLMIDYIGHDPRLINKSKNWYLSNNVKDVLPILEEWKQWHTTQPPSPESLCP